MHCGSCLRDQVRELEWPAVQVGKHPDRRALQQIALRPTVDRKNESRFYYGVAIYRYYRLQKLS